MLKSVLLAAALCLSLGSLTACKKLLTSDDADQGSVETLNAERKSAVAKLRTIKDPVQEEIYAYRLQVRQAYNERRFDELETQVAQVRNSKAVFGNGSWKLVQFYDSLGCRDEEPDSMWTLHDQIHQAWIAAKPDSMAARAAYADFQTEYAWKARGSGYANTVTEDGWKLYEERLKAAHRTLKDARKLVEKDPEWWRAALGVALGEGMPKDAYDKLTAEAVAYEPTFWGFDTTRAYSLLPRWYGAQGDWEAYADAAAKRPGGLGAETYARVVINLHGYYDNVFHETQASWLLTREGLAQLRRKYPASVGLLHVSAELAVLAEDRPLAKELFDQIGDGYLPDQWYKPARFVQYRQWAQTGHW